MLLVMLPHPGYHPESLNGEFIFLYLTDVSVVINMCLT